MAKFKVGDKVRVVADVSNKGVVGEVTSTDGRVVYFDYVKDGRQRSDWWNESRFELVTKGGEVSKPYQRKTYRLLKETPTVRKGAIYQERCDDGTQPFDLITKEHFKGELVGARADSISDRALVEDRKFFVEVFAVDPAYMTQPELDEWEAFKSRKKPGSKKSYETPEVVREARKHSDHGWKWTPAQRAAASKRAKASWARRRAAQPNVKDLRTVA